MGANTDLLRFEIEVAALQGSRRPHLCTAIAPQRGSRAWPQMLAIHFRINSDGPEPQKPAAMSIILDLKPGRDDAEAFARYLDLGVADFNRCRGRAIISADASSGGG